jgi:hypothetical protein
MPGDMPELPPYEPRRWDDPAVMLDDLRYAVEQLEGAPATLSHWRPIGTTADGLPEGLARDEQS